MGLPVILDADIGGEPDDAMALVIAARELPELTLVVTSDEMSGQRARFARLLLDAAGGPTSRWWPAASSARRRFSSPRPDPGIGRRTAGRRGRRGPCCLRAGRRRRALDRARAPVQPGGAALPGSRAGPSAVHHPADRHGEPRRPRIGAAQFPAGSGGRPAGADRGTVPALGGFRCRRPPGMRDYRGHPRVPGAGRSGRRPAAALCGPARVPLPPVLCPLSPGRAASRPLALAAALRLPFTPFAWAVLAADAAGRISERRGGRAVLLSQDIDYPAFARWLRARLDPRPPAPAGRAPPGCPGPRVAATYLVPTYPPLT